MTSFCVSFPSIKLLFRQLLVKILDPVATPYMCPSMRNERCVCTVN